MQTAKQIIDLKDKLFAVVCPKQKIVKVYSCRGRKGVLLKTYRFKEKIPQVEKTIEVEHYDYSEWCVSERASVSEKIVKVYDQSIIDSIRKRTIDFYINETFK